MTTIKINPSVKKEITNVFGENNLSNLLIKTYEGVYNHAIKDGFTLEQGHKIAMDSLIEFTKLFK